MVSTVQLTYISAVKLVAGEPWILSTGIQPIAIQSAFSFTTAFCKISSTAALTKLLLAIEQHVKTAALSPPLPARRQESSRLLTNPGQSTVKSMGVIRSRQDA